MHDEEEEWQQRRLQHQLEIQSHQIERVLSHHDVEAQVVGGEVRSGRIHFDLQGQLAMGMEKVRLLKDDLMRSLGTTAVNVKEKGDHLQVEMDKPAPLAVPLLDLDAIAQPMPRLSAAIGMSEDGRSVILNFSTAKTTHVLLTGQDGAGKTTLLRTLAVSLAMNNRQSRLQLIVIAPQPNLADIPYTLFEPLQHLPHLLTRPYYGIDEAAEALEFLNGEMLYRREQQMNTPALVVLIDDIAPLIDKRAALRKQLVSVLQHGNDVGIHLVMGVQDAETAVNDSPIRANLSHRIVGRCVDSRQSQIATGIGNAQAEYLLGNGDFLFVHHGESVYFQAAGINDYDLHMTLQKLHRNRPRPLLAQSFSPRPAMDTEEAEDAAPQQFIFDGHSVTPRYDTQATWTEEGEEIYDPFPFDISLDDMPPPPEEPLYH